MKPWRQACWQGMRFCGACVVSFCVWTLWLVLAIALACQIYIASAHELSVPPFVLRALEARLSASGVTVKFGHTIFDPSGRLLVENCRFFLQESDEPAATAQLLFVEIDPWALLAGRFEPQRLRASGVSLWVPAMLSPSGRTENLVQDADVTLTPADKGVELHQLTARVAGMPVTARGSLNIGAIGHERTAPLPLAQIMAENYETFCHRLVALSRHIATLRAPSADVVFRPSLNRTAIAQLQLLADGVDFDAGQPLHAGPIVLSTRLPLTGSVPVLGLFEAQADTLDLPGGAHVTGVRGTIRMRINPGDRKVQFRRADLTAASVTVQDVALDSVSLRTSGPSLPQLQVAAVARLGREGIAVDGDLDCQTRRAQLHAVGHVDPSVLTLLEHRTGKDIRRFIDFSRAPAFDLTARLDPGAKFAGVEGRVDATQVTAHEVTFDTIGGHIAFDGRRFVATDAYASIGDNHATGSYEQTIATREFRFLLAGRLRPPAISGLFRDWWPRFWDNFDFAAALPDASVDVQGRWGQVLSTSVYVYADCRNPVIRGQALDHAITRIYLRPFYYDAQEIFATKGAGSTRGTFVRRLAVTDDGLKFRRMDFDFDTTLDPATAIGLAGPAVGKVLAPFAFTQAPHVRVRGTLNARPGEEGDERDADRHLFIEGGTDAALSYHGFPLQGLTITAQVNNDDILVEPLSVGFAGGIATGKLRITGAAGQEKLGFDLGLKGANLRQAITTVDDFTALRDGTVSRSSSTYMKTSANVTMDLGVSAEGALGDPYSFTGTGNAELNGRGLGEIKLLGLLSDLLNFTALRFNNLRTNFSIDRDQLNFSEVSVTGSNAAVAAHGSYALKPHTLDFSARVYPFQESKFILKSVLGAVLTPLSTVLTVKLTGKLEKPSWAFVLGPTNFIRSLTQSVDDKPEAPATPAKPPPQSGP